MIWPDNVLYGFIWFIVPTHWDRKGTQCWSVSICQFVQSEVSCHHLKDFVQLTSDLAYMLIGSDHIPLWPYGQIFVPGFEISLVWLSEMSKNLSRTSGIPAGLVRRTTAYFWFSHKLHWLYIFQTSEWYIQTSGFYNPLARWTSAFNLKFRNLCPPGRLQRSKIWCCQALSQEVFHSVDFKSCRCAYWMSIHKRLNFQPLANMHWWTYPYIVNQALTKKKKKSAKFYSILKNYKMLCVKYQPFWSSLNANHGQDGPHENHHTIFVNICSWNTQSGGREWWFTGT